MHVGDRIALTHSEILDTFERKGGDVGNLWSFDAKEIGSVHVLEHEYRTHVFMLSENLHIVHFDAFHVPNEKPMGRHIPEPSGLRITFPFLLGRLKRCLRRGTAAAVLD